jgi:inosine-uridine nucleoside N-ribohydrolase
MDANYDDTLALLYIAKSPNFALKAISVEADGMGTPHGGPTNMAAVARFLGLDSVPIAFGQQQSLSPIATMPLQWRIEVDEFFERMYSDRPNGSVLEMTDSAISTLSAPRLINQVLKQSACPVVVLCTGPVTSLAVALDMEPSVVENIHSLYMMGSSYGAFTNNVYDWQMTYNGVRGSCSEDGGQTFTGLNRPLVTSLVRPGCRGVNMTEHGNTDWNVFMDVLAWRKVYSYLKDKKAGEVYVLAANATLNMPVTLPAMEAHAETLSDERLRIFVLELAKAFLKAGEAKWWDVQSAVMMDEIMSGNPIGVCSKYAKSKRTSVSLVWRSLLKSGELNPYGSVRDDEYAEAPPIDYCLDGDSERMWAVYWPMINRSNEHFELV